MLVELLPESNEIVVQDTLQLEPTQTSFEFTLNSGLKITSSSTRVSEITSSKGLSSKTYRVENKMKDNRLILSYRGKPIFSKSVDQRVMPQGIISQQGVYLDGSSAWYPLTNANVTMLDMTLKLPTEWQSDSIGKRTVKNNLVRWKTRVPHDNIYLLAGKYERYNTTHKGIDLSVLLLSRDAQLAKQYLSLMDDYIDLYGDMFGEYPFAKFSVVENRWQTGLGMPSFTLLGSRVIRLPFIPYTSLPHEVLHNWLGNGIWIDYQDGNWSEGLTAYLSDHLMKEFSDKGAQYRLQALQRYTNYAADDNDSPLLDFTHRHNDASQSIGYSKSLMLFHMLRRELGDPAFLDALKRLWKEHRYQAIGFRQALQTLSSTRPDLMLQLEQWVTTAGAPSLSVEDIQLADDKGDYRLKLDISQHGPETFEFTLPVMLTFEQGMPAVSHLLQMRNPSHTFELELQRKPLRIDIDPAYDVMRYLDRSEQPPALSQLFGDRTWLVLPSDAPETRLRSWLTLAKQWQARYPDWHIITDEEVDSIPKDSPIMILGYDNLLLGRYQERLSGSIRVPDDRSSTSQVIVDNEASGHILGFIGCDDPDMIVQLARKLPHYGSYGKLVFDNKTSQAIERSKLRSKHSKLSILLSAQPTGLILPKEQKLVSPVAVNNTVH
jgi:hypothetical protein